MLRKFLVFFFLTSLTQSFKTEFDSQLDKQKKTNQTVKYLIFEVNNTCFVQVPLFFFIYLLSFGMKFQGIVDASYTNLIGKKIQIFLGPLDVVLRGERTGHILSLNSLPVLLNLIQVNLHIKLVPPICKLENKF